MFGWVDSIVGTRVPRILYPVLGLQLVEMTCGMSNRTYDFVDRTASLDKYHRLKTFSSLVGSFLSYSAVTFFVGGIPSLFLSHRLGSIWLAPLVLNQIILFQDFLNTLTKYHVKKMRNKKNSAETENKPVETNE